MQSLWSDILDFFKNTWSEIVGFFSGLFRVNATA